MFKRLHQKPALQRKERLYEFLCVVPALLLILLLHYYPIVKLVQISFTDWNLIRKGWHYVGLKNWKWFLTQGSSHHFLDSFVVTIKYTIGHMALSIGLGLVAAFLFGRMSKAYHAMRTVVFMPHYVGMSTAALLFLVILNPDFGVANYLLECLGLQRINMLGTGQLALLWMILIASWRTIGYDMLIYLSALQSVSPSYREAARIDGASGWQVFRFITLPLLGPTTMFLVVTQFISSMKVYALIDVLTQGGPFMQTEVLVYKIYELAFRDFRIDHASILAILFFLFLLLVTKLTMKYGDRRVNYDA